MFGKTLPALLLTLICALSCLGQQTEAPKEKAEKPCEPQILAERIAAAQKNQEGDLKTIGQRAHLKNSLPADADAWVVEIVTTGGFTGKGLPTVTLASNGNLIVGDDDAFTGNQVYSAKIRRLDADVLQKIAQIVKTENLTETLKNAADKSDSGQKEISFLCSDCFQTSITVVRRNADGEIRYFSNREKTLIFSGGDFNQIHQIIMEKAGFLK